MAILTGNDGSIKLSTAVGGAVNSTALAAVRSFSVEMTRDTIETSTMGQDFRTYVNGMSSWSGTADIYFDSSGSAPGHLSVYPVLNPTNTTSGTVGQGTLAVELYLGPSTSGKFSGNIIITGFTVNSSMDGMVEASISFQGSSVCAFTA
jgi:predicted secreted protein